MARTGFPSGFLLRYSEPARRGASGPEVGAGFHDPTHLVEPPGRPFTTTGAECADASGRSTDRVRRHVQRQPSGRRVVGLIPVVAGTVHAMSVGVGLRQWLSKGSSSQGLFLQTIVRRRRIPSGMSLSLPTPERACPFRHGPRGTGSSDGAGSVRAARAGIADRVWGAGEQARFPLERG